MNLSFTRHTLANGLDVLLHEDHDCPIVAINVWYHVGSKNEQPGHTGFAHLFEHLMFEGSAHHDHGYFQPLQGAGASLNGSTNADRTNYWEVVPTGALELGLWMESDRMGYLLPALTEAKFSNQRAVVLNERRQNYENRPYGLSAMAIVAALFPPDHPYHWTTIGEVADLNAVRLDEVHAFFARYYHPANASLTLAGDIDPDHALALVRAYFEEIPAGEKVEPVRATASLDGDVRIVLEDRVELPRLYMAWLSPAMFAEGDADLDLAADAARQRQDVAPVSPARVRGAHRDRRVGVAEFPGDRRIPAAGGDRGARPHAWRARTRDSGRNRPAGRRAGRPTTRSSAAGCRRKPSSCSGCRRSADSAASRIS